MQRRRALLAIGLASLSTFRSLRADVTATWNGSTNYWTTGAAWSGGVVPANNSPSGALYDVNINGGVVMFNPSSGTYTDTVQTVNLAGGQLSGPALLTANAGFTFSGTNVWPQSQTNYVTLINPVGATSTLLQNGFAYLPNAIFINNGTFNALSGSQLDATFNNSGTLNVNGGSGTVYFGTTLNGPGTLNVVSGTLELLGYTPGTLLQQQFPKMAAGTTLQVYDYYAGESSQESEAFLGFNSPNANYVVNSCKVTLSSNLSYGAATTQLNGAELDLYSNYASTGGLTLTAGSTLKMLSTSGNLLVTGNFNSSGNANLSAGSIYSNGSGGVYSGTLSLLSNTSLVNNGTLTLSPAGAISLQNGGSLVNNGTMNVGAGAFNSGGSFINAGSFYVNPGSGAVFSDNSSFNNSGTAYVQSGTLQINGASSGVGIYNVSAGASLLFAQSIQNPISILGQGTATFNGPGGTFWSTTLSSVGTVSLVFTSDVLAGCNQSNVTLSGLTVAGGSELSGSASFNVSGPVILIGGDLFGVTVIANGGLTFGPNGFEQISGKLTNAAGQTASCLGATAPGYIDLESGGVFTNAGTYNAGPIGVSGPGGAFINTGVVNFNSSTPMTVGTFNNSGTIYYNAPAGSPYIQSPNFINTGTVDVLAGNLLINPAAYGASNTLGGSLSIAASAKATVVLYPNQQLTASVTGAGSLTIQGSGVIAPASFNFSGTTFLSSALTIAAGNNFGATGPVVVTGKVTLAAGNSGNLSVRYIPSLTINASDSVIVQLSNTSSSRTLLSLGSLSLLGTLDLGNNDMQVSNASLSSLWTALQTGYANGNWNGSGLISTAAKNDTQHLLTLGIMQNNQGGKVQFTASHPFDGRTPSSADILVKSTYYGDANLDGLVDGSDYTRIDNGHLAGASGWFNGDFNYDGTVNGSDYTLIDNAFNVQGAQISASSANPTDQIAGQPSASVPEPDLSGISLLASAVLSTRYRRQRLGVR